MKILLPSMPSLYITSFLFQACEEIQRVGGHVLDKPILKNFASRLLDKVLKDISFSYSSIFNVFEKSHLIDILSWIIFHNCGKGMKSKKEPNAIFLS